ncbi:MAG: ABC transporter substrate-binding protein [Leptospiraceae bacterium]|nr:ABC transporter substrate-binding protein [Leptospiraceae bacterium]MCB1303854.1 ABC transporter substrate-binding protein [Leptospiraceae bacterium]
MKVNRIIIAAFLTLTGGLYGEPAQPGELEKVRLQLKWKHQFQFAGYYAAIEKGYYREAGLEVEIREAQEGEQFIRRVLDGDAEFGVGTTDLLLLRSQGEPVVVLAVLFQHSPLSLMMRKDSGIQTLHQLEGRRVMIEPHSAELYAYLNREGVSISKLIQPPHSFDARSLVNGEADAMSVYITDEPFALHQEGTPYLLFSPRAAGIDFYGDNLFTTEQQLRDHPERVKAFREASLKGWKYAMAHQEEIIQLIYNKYSKRHSMEHLRFEAAQMRLLMPDIVEIGHMFRGRWEHIASVYAELGMMPRGYKIDGFMYDPDPHRDYTWLYIALGITLAVALVVSGIAIYIHSLNLHLRRSEEMRKEAERLIQHDLKGPLGVILGHSEMLIADPQGSPHSAIYQRIYRSAAHMLELLERSLEIMEMESGRHKLKRERINLSAVLADLISGFEPFAAKKKVTLLCYSGDQTLDAAEPCFYNGEVVYLKSMLANLLKNAIEAAPEDSYVTVQMQRDHDVRIFIHNQGLIPLDLQKTFFERYAKGKSSRGSGLGTYSARLIARAHGGDITFTSNPEQGTEIQVSLPVEP